MSPAHREDRVECRALVVREVAKCQCVVLRLLEKTQHESPTGLRVLPGVHALQVPIKDQQAGYDCREDNDEQKALEHY